MKVLERRVEDRKGMGRLQEVRIEMVQHWVICQGLGLGCWNLGFIIREIIDWLVLM
jgi:hypothetical protein